MAITMATVEPCLYPSVCTGTITGTIASGMLDAALAAALGVSPNILGGTFTLSADNLVYDDEIGEFEGVVTTKRIVLRVEQVPAPPALTLLAVGIAGARPAPPLPLMRPRMELRWLSQRMLVDVELQLDVTARQGSGRMRICRYHTCTLPPPCTCSAMRPRCGIDVSGSV